MTGWSLKAWLHGATSFNDRPIPGRDTHNRDGTVRILWNVGIAMTYRL